MDGLAETAPGLDRFEAQSLLARLRPHRKQIARFQLWGRLRPQAECYIATPSGFVNFGTRYLLFMRLQPELPTKNPEIERFKRRMMINDPQTELLFEFGVFNDQLFICSQYLHGISLAALARHQPPSCALALALLARIDELVDRTTGGEVSLRPGLGQLRLGLDGPIYLGYRPIHDDLRQLKQLKEFEESNFIDLNILGPQLGFESIGAKRLSALVLGGRISKRQQVSNWEAARLSEAQVNYAATDAWICREIYLDFQRKGLIT